MTSTKQSSTLQPDERWEVSSSDLADLPANFFSDDLVLAWARDIETKEIRYISTLGPERNGKKSGCECYSCKRELLAINNAKREFKRGDKKPHFRHPEGSAKTDCLVLSARAVALEMLAKHGTLELPRRQQSARVEGLSGTYYEAWVESKPERVSIANFSVRDEANAILRLDDGRQLIVRLVGTLDANAIELSGSSTLTPTIILIVDDPDVAAMSPEDLRKRLTLVVDRARWCSHWEDEHLIQQATEDALAKAKHALDWLDCAEYEFPENISAAERRETLLHLKAKEILEMERQIRLPSLEIKVTESLSNGDTLTESSVLPSQLVLLDNVVLEKRLGQIRPDVLATTIGTETWQSGPILIEITVTNAIRNERLERIRQQGIPAIEIDISRMGGVVTEDEFRNLVVREVAGKNWLYHPWIEQETDRLTQLLSGVVEEFNQKEQAKADRLRKIKEQEAEEQKQRIQAAAEKTRKHLELKMTPIESWRERYLGAVMFHGNVRAYADDPDADPQVLEEARTQVRESAEGLAAHGYPEAEDEDLFRRQGNILERLLSIRKDRAIGYRLQTAWQVINAILQENHPHSQWQTLYLIAIKHYSPTLNPSQQTRITEWREAVKASLLDGEMKYRRSAKYDRLLAFLFPEMAKGINTPLPNRKTEPSHVDGPMASLPPKESSSQHLRDYVPKTTPSRDRGRWKIGIVSPNRFQDPSIIEFGKSRRDASAPFAQSLVECSKQFNYSESYILGRWIAAGVAESV